MTSERTNVTGAPTRAAAAAAVLMLILGLAYRIVVAQLTGPVSTAAMTSEDLARLPMTIAEWTAVESALDPAMVEAADTDAHISRTYSSPLTAARLWLYVAYGVRARDLAPHRPEVCYPQSGWLPDGLTEAELPGPDNTKLPCSILHFSRGDMGGPKIVIIDYYIIEGQYYRDVDALRWRAWKGAAAVKSVAQVQILATVTADIDPENAAETARQFAIESAGPILELFTTPACERIEPATTEPEID